MSARDEAATELIELGRSVVQRAREAGADVAEASVHSGSHLSVKVRKGEPELVEEPDVPLHLVDDRVDQDGLPGCLVAEEVGVGPSLVVEELTK